MGLVNRVVAPEALEAEALAFARAARRRGAARGALHEAGGEQAA